jgi:hypothetical protein
VADERYGKSGVRSPTVGEIATAAMSAMAKVLHDAGCLSEPVKPPTPMTLDEAAALVIQAARTPRLDHDDPADVADVVNNRAQFEYAWACAARPGVNPADTDLHTARRLLAEHHGLR